MALHSLTLPVDNSSGPYMLGAQSVVQKQFEHGSTSAADVGIDTDVRRAINAAKQKRGKRRD